jgi:hypothetical protein
MGKRSALYNIDWRTWGVRGEGRLSFFVGVDVGVIVSFELNSEVLDVFSVFASFVLDGELVGVVLRTEEAVARA